MNRQTVERKHIDYLEVESRAAWVSLRVVEALHRTLWSMRDEVPAAKPLQELFATHFIKRIRDAIQLVEDMQDAEREYERAIRQWRDEDFDAAFDYFKFEYGVSTESQELDEYDDETYFREFF